MYMSYNAINVTDPILMPRIVLDCRLGKEVGMAPQRIRLVTVEKTR